MTDHISWKGTFLHLKPILTYMRCFIVNVFFCPIMSSRNLIKLFCIVFAVIKKLMSRTSNFDSEFYNPVYHFDSPSYGRQSTRRPFDVPKDGEERKEAVIIVVLIIGILIFFVIKLIIDHYKRSKNSTDCNRTIRTDVMRAG